MRSLLLPLLLLLPLPVAGCRTLRSPETAEPGASYSVADWAAVLGSVDDGGRVDYEGLDRDALNRYVALLALPREFASRDDELAHWINAYNALVVFQVVERWPIGSVADRKATFFYWTRFEVNGRTLSLYAIENDIVRGFGDPRIHFALNCASAGCPRLPREPFSGARLDEQLERETRRFLVERRNVLVDDGELVLSEIFDWFEEDFEPDPVSWIRTRRPAIPAGLPVRYRPWDWTLNSR